MARKKMAGDPPLYEFDKISLLAGRMQGMETCLTAMTETLDALEEILLDWEDEFLHVKQSTDARVIVFEEGDES